MPSPPIAYPDRILTSLYLESNPFARKTATDNTRNPFARQAENNKSLHKSESFFNAVEAAETDKSKREFVRFVKR